jgi:hypothetical protein
LMSSAAACQPCFVQQRCTALLTPNMSKAWSCWVPGADQEKKYTDSIR